MDYEALQLDSVGVVFIDKKEYFCREEEHKRHEKSALCGNLTTATGEESISDAFKSNRGFRARMPNTKYVSYHEADAKENTTVYVPVHGMDVDMQAAAEPTGASTVMESQLPNCGDDNGVIQTSENTVSTLARDQGQGKNTSVLVLASDGFAAAETTAVPIQPINLTDGQRFQNGDAKSSLGIEIGAGTGVSRSRSTSDNSTESISLRRTVKMARFPSDTALDGGLLTGERKHLSRIDTPNSEDAAHESHQISCETTADVNLGGLKDRDVSEKHAAADSDGNSDPNKDKTNNMSDARTDKVSGKDIPLITHGTGTSENRDVSMATETFPQLLQPPPGPSGQESKAEAVSGISDLSVPSEPEGLKNLREEEPAGKGCCVII